MGRGRWGAASSRLLDHPPGQVLGWTPAFLSALAVSRVTARLNYTVRLLALSRQRGWRRLRWRKSKGTPEASEASRRRFPGPLEVGAGGWSPLLLDARAGPGFRDVLL